MLRTSVWILNQCQNVFQRTYWCTIGRTTCATRVINICYVTSLCPVAEHLSVSSVRDKFLWKLRDFVVQIVHNHMHDGGRVYTYCWVVADCVRSEQ